MLKHIIFDYDGVLTPSFEFHRERIKDVMGIALTTEEYRAIHDGNFFETIENIERAKNADWSHYRSELKHVGTEMPCDDEMIDVVHALGDEHTLHVISSGESGVIRDFLEKHDVLSYFSTIWGSGEGLSKHEKFEKFFVTENTDTGECVFVTDTLGDIHEAHAVELDTIAVTFGFHDRERLEKGAPKLIVDSWDEIREAVRTF